MAAAVTHTRCDLSVVVFPWVITSSTPMDPADVPTTSLGPSALEHTDTTDDCRGTKVAGRAAKKRAKSVGGGGGGGGAGDAQRVAGASCGRLVRTLSVFTPTPQCVSLYPRQPQKLCYAMHTG